MTFSANTSNIKKFCAKVLCVALLIMLSFRAQAGCQWVGEGNANTSMNAPSSLLASPDAPLLSPLTEWLEQTYNPYWTCSSTLNWTNVGAFVSTPAAASSYQFEGFTVYKTSVPGVGFVGRMRSIHKNGQTAEEGLKSTDRGVSVSSPSKLGFSLGIRLIKIGPIPPGTRLESTVVAKGTSYVGSTPDLITRVRIGPIDFIVPTCQTPNVDVQLGNVYISKFHGVDSEAGNKDFEITLQNCPGGFSKISYRLDPINPVLDPSKGLLQIDQSSEAASGVAVRIKGRGFDAKFGDEQNLSSYTGTAGNYHIPFTASYYQTGSIKPGAANASLEFTIKYQ
ncbi:fimbrial protein [Pseudomonas aeruginosa]|uniref:fimbrial protein n=1 Tax=Pseudomonas aeruginosa TaxID=287 RepID=UPI0010698802|nr:fimbrial protein [Pseudomonas aeruginosa]